VALLAQQQTCDSQVTGLNPGWAPLQQLTSYLHLCASVTKQYNLAKGVISLTGKVTADLVESNGSLPLGL